MARLSRTRLHGLIGTRDAQTTALSLRSESWQAAASPLCRGGPSGDRCMASTPCAALCAPHSSGTSLSASRIDIASAMTTSSSGVGQVTRGQSKDERQAGRSSSLVAS